MYGTLDQAKPIRQTESHRTYFLRTSTTDKIPSTFRGAPVIAIDDLSEIVRYELQRPADDRGKGLTIGVSSDHYASLRADYNKGRVPENFLQLDRDLTDELGGRWRTYANNFSEINFMKKEDEGSGRFKRSA